MRTKKPKEDPASHGSYVPRRKSGARRGDPRGRPVQTFLDPKLSERFDEYLVRHDLTAKECLIWLIDYAVRSDLEPPEED